MKLACVVVLYHPSEEVENNIRTYLPQVDCILKWDNTPHNVGIGAALNEGVRMARAQGCTHLMTMDQDRYDIKQSHCVRCNKFGQADIHWERLRAPTIYVSSFDSQTHAVAKCRGSIK